MSELLPCPFCGGEAKVYEMQYGADGQYSVFGVFCVDDSNSELIGLSKYQHGHFIDNFPTPAEAIAAWNSRAERTCKNVDDHKTVWFICSVCGYQQKLSHTRSYCPNCGARRVGE